MSRPSKSSHINHPPPGPLNILLQTAIDPTTLTKSSTIADITNTGPNLLPAEPTPHAPTQRIHTTTNGTPASRISPELLSTFTGKSNDDRSATTPLPAGPDLVSLVVAMHRGHGQRSDTLSDSPNKRHPTHQGQQAAVRLAHGQEAPVRLSRNAPWSTPISISTLARDHISLQHTRRSAAVVGANLDFLERIRDALSSPIPHRTSAPEFQFQFSNEAALHNLEVLRRYDMDLGKAIAAQHTTPLAYGSEFRSTTALQPLIGFHPLWPRIESILLHGTTFPLKPLSDAHRIADRAFMLSRGNHKSASTYQSKLRENIRGDIEAGYALPLPVSCINDLGASSIAPLGMVKQSTTDENGNPKDKYRMTHDQSFPGPSLLSVNKRVIPEELPPCLYGNCLRRLIHYIVDLRRRHPTRCILIGKLDIKSAYRRAHLSSTTALESMTIFDNLLHIALRMTFGGSPCPPLWGCISESLCDLTNDLLQCDEWDPYELHSPHQCALKSPVVLADDIPFAPAADLLVDLPPNDKGKADVYIDDLITICPASQNNIVRGAAAAALALHIYGRPVDPREPLSRDDLLALAKFVGEGFLAEEKRVLGWDIDTRRLLISLPLDKFTEWHQQIQAILQDPCVPVPDLDTLVGRLVHVSYVLFAMKHFLNRLYKAQTAGRKRPYGTIRLSRNVLDDLRLCDEFLHHATAGISLNLLTFRRPTHFYRSDASEHGIGGYSLVSGNAWRYELPVDCRIRVSLNTLEFAACFITFWCDALAGHIQPNDCLLSQTDSTSAAGWLRKSSFDDVTQPAQMYIARKMSRVVMTTRCCLYSQWFPGEDNIVADSLSPSSWFSSLSTSHRDQLLADLTAAASARADGATKSTDAKQTLAWSRWNSYLQSIGCEHDPFLDNLDRPQRWRIVGAFAAAMRCARFSDNRFEQLAEGTISGTIGYVAQTFRIHDRPDPRHDDTGRITPLLSRQFAGYRNADPGEKQQKAITISILRRFMSSAITHREKALAQLTFGAFFFAMRSCEYSDTPKQEEKVTKILCLGNIAFLRSRRPIPHTDPNLSRSDSVTITFEHHKASAGRRQRRNEPVTHFRNGDLIACPVRLWAGIVQRVRSYPGTTDESPVNTVLHHGKLVTMSSAETLKYLRLTAKAIGPTELGFLPEEIGTHSLRSGAAMSMTLAGIPVYIIMLLGRWSSDAFLRYIRRQIQEFSEGVSTRMLTHESFFTVPTASVDDPRVSGNPANHACRNNVGRHAQSWAAHTRLSQYA